MIFWKIICVIIGIGFVLLVVFACIAIISSSPINWNGQDAGFLIAYIVHRAEDILIFFVVPSILFTVFIWLSWFAFRYRGKGIPSENLDEIKKRQERSGSKGDSMDINENQDIGATHDNTEL